MQLNPLPISGGPVYTLIFWAAFALWVTPELVAWKIKRSADALTARDRGSLILISVLWWSGILADFCFALLLPQAAIVWHRTVVFIAGVCLMLAGIALRWYCVTLLGPFFTFDVTTHAGQTVIETGPYRYIRHPSYPGALVTLLGFGLALGNWAGLAAALACLGFAYAYRIPIEEAALIAALGSEYRQYMGRTWRLVPYLF